MRLKHLGIFKNLFTLIKINTKCKNNVGLVRKYIKVIGSLTAFIAAGYVRPHALGDIKKTLLEGVKKQYNEHLDASIETGK